jgi:hypothetical protein
VMRSRCVLLFVCLGAAPPPAASAPAPTWSAALRYRLEQVQQEGLVRDALASTARLRLAATCAALVALASDEWWCCGTAGWIACTA